MAARLMANGPATQLTSAFSSFTADVMCQRQSDLETCPLTDFRLCSPLSKVSTAKKRSLAAKRTICRLQPCAYFSRLSVCLLFRMKQVQRLTRALISFFSILFGATNRRRNSIGKPKNSNGSSPLSDPSLVSKR